MVSGAETALDARGALRHQKHALQLYRYYETLPPEIVIALAYADLHRVSTMDKVIFTGLLRYLR